MRLKNYFATFVAVVGGAALHAGCGYDGIWDLNFGYRHDALKWSLAGQEGFPNIFAEMNWDNIHCFQVATRYILSGWDSIYLRVEGNFGWIVQADPVYSIYLENNRQDIFSQEAGSRGGDKVLGAKGGMGFHLLRNTGPFDLAFIGGYSFQSDRIRFRDPKLVYSQSQPLMAVDSLVVKYRPKWYGGFVAMDAALRYKTYITVTASYELHYAAYRAHGVWNWTEPTELQMMNDNFQYNRQQWQDSATAWGHCISASFTWNTSENWFIGFFGNVQYFRTRDGEYDVTEYANVTNPDAIYVVTFPNNTDNLNSIKWFTFYAGFSLECQF